MRSGKQPHGARPLKSTSAQLMRVFDEIQFGPDRTLNLRESLPTGAEAKRRADRWIRERQIAGAEPLLVITGRGNNSVDGIPVIKREILSLLLSLKRQGVVSGWREHTAGSFVVDPAPLSARFNAAPRRRDIIRQSERNEKSNPALAGLSGLEKGTLDLLRHLALRSLEELGVRDSESLIESEMLAKVSLLSDSSDAAKLDEPGLRRSILRALEEMDG
jgi:hypothetical protein